MRTGKTPMGAIEPAMLDLAGSQVGKYLGLPTHAYLVAGDGKIIDGQMEIGERNLCCAGRAGGN
jgi:trimethylamine---corrinoid protein Co-methyltransferase